MTVEPIVVSGAPVASENSDSGNGVVAPKPGVASPPAAVATAPSFETVLAGLTEENRQFVTKKGWKDPDAMIKSHAELERTLSTRPQAPIVPDKPEGYQFKLPTGLDPATINYDAKSASQLAKWAHDAKLSPEQAQSLHDSYIGFVAKTVQENGGARGDKVVARIESTAADLEKAWGAQDTPTFKRNLELSRRAIKNLDPDFKAALVELGAITQHDNTEVVANASVMKALAKVGAGMFAEDTLFGSFTAGNNPFTRGSDGKEDTTGQLRLIRENPALAETLILAAGAADRFKSTLTKIRSDKSASARA